MPKIIPELRERFIEAARDQLLRDHDITIRKVAKECETAVGTVYNYFPSKEALLAAVMMDDWLACCRQMHEGAAAAGDPVSAIRQATAALRRFTASYAPLWRNYASARDSVDALSLRHRQIIRAISGVAGEVLERFSISGDAHLPEVLAELILLASRTDDGFERIAGVLERILA